MLRRNLFVKGVVALPLAAFALVGWAGIAAAQDKPTPDKAKDVVETALADKNFSTLCDLLKQAGLVNTLKEAGPYTVFAPTNEAFAKLPKATLDELKDPENKEWLKHVLTFHVVKGKHPAANVTKMKSVKTLCGEEATIKTEGETVMIGKAKITKTDIHCANGVIHVIDTVLIPPKKE